MHARSLLTPTDLLTGLAQLDGWTLHGDGADLAITKRLGFSNFYETMAFVNALAFVANQQDHHPDLQVSYGHCVVCWRTHDSGGVTALDLHCATLTDRLMSQSSGPA